MKALLCGFLLLAPSAWAAEVGPLLQLAHRIEITPNNGGTQFQACDFYRCTTIGKDFYSQEEIQKALGKNSKNDLVKGILQAATGKQPATFALLEKPYMQNGKRKLSAVGSGGTFFGSVLEQIPGRPRPTASSFVVELPRDTATAFQYFDSQPALGLVKTGLLKVLK